MRRWPAGAATPQPPRQRRAGLRDQLGDDLGDRLLGRRPCRPTARPSPSRAPHRRRSPRGAARRPRNARSRAARPPRDSSPAWNRRDHLAPDARRKRRVPSLTRPRTGITGKRASSCTERHRVARAGADEGLLEARMRDALRRRRRSACRAARRPRPSPDRPRIASPRPMPPATNTGTSLDMRQDLLRQHGERDRADMAAGLRALDHQRVGARRAPAASPAPAPARSRSAWRRHP